MITRILYRCPKCGGFEWLEKGHCRYCRASVQMLSRKRVAVDGEAGSIAHWYGRVREYALPRGPGGMVLKSGPIRLSLEKRKGVFKGFSGVHAVLHGREAVDRGTLVLYDSRLLFKGASLEKTILFASISAVTIESNTVIVDRTDGRTLYFDFLEESGKQWEDCIQKAVADYFQPLNIVEFCPKIRFSGTRGRKGTRPGQFHQLRVAAGQGYHGDVPHVSAFLKALADGLVRGLLDIRMSGLGNIPSRGAGILASNHVSLLDGIILGACLPRLVRFMTKNSPFNNPVVQTILRMAGAFPVRRYRTDVVAVRNAWRVLQKKHLLGVFPEGERSWDGTMLPFKRGTLRLMLAAGKPVIPVGISGIYELMPRWTHSIKRVPVRINVGRPMQFSRISTVDQTEADILLAEKQLCEAIQGMIA